MLTTPFDRGRLWLALLIAGAVSPVGVSQVNDWSEEALLLYNAGSPEINDLRGRSARNERLKSYAAALGLLFNEPLRESNALIARSTFDTLFEANPRDDIGRASAYYLAQINHRHLDQPDLEAAREAYRALFEAQPGYFFGELAFLKYLLLELYADDSAETPVERIERLEKMGERLYIPDMRRSYHRTLGEAYRGFEISDEKAFDHLKAAYEIESSVPETQTDLLWSLAELAEQLGHRQVAINALEDFLRTATWDDRRGEVASRLATLKRK